MFCSGVVAVAPQSNGVVLPASLAVPPLVLPLLLLHPARKDVTREHAEMA